MLIDNIKLISKSTNISLSHTSIAFPFKQNNVFIKGEAKITQPNPLTLMLDCMYQQHTLIRFAIKISTLPISFKRTVKITLKNNEQCT